MHMLVVSSKDVESYSFTFFYHDIKNLRNSSDISKYHFHKQHLIEKLLLADRKEGRASQATSKSEKRFLKSTFLSPC